MIAVDSWLRVFWLATWAHLWQTTLVLVVIFLLARLIDSGPARLVNGLWWAGLAKLFLPLPFLGPLGARLGQALFSARGTAPSAAARTGLETAAVFLDPRALADSSAPAAAGRGGAVFLTLTLAWATGAGWLVWRWARDARRLRGTGAAVLATAPDDIRQRLETALERTVIPREKVLVVARSEMPAVSGVLRPAIVMPQDVVRELDADELRAILLHEEGHLRRRDPLLAAVQRLALVFFYYYPPLWLLIRRLKSTAECACDERVVEAGISPELFARALAHAVTLGLAPAAGAAAASTHPSLLRRRLGRILACSRPRATSRHRIAVAAGVLLVLLASFFPLLPLAAPQETVSGTGPGDDWRFPAARVHVSHLEVSAVDVNSQDLPLEPSKWIGVRVHLAVDDQGRALDAFAEPPVEYLLPDEWQSFVAEERRAIAAASLSEAASKALRDAAVQALLGSRLEHVPGQGGPVQGEIDVVWQIPKGESLPSGTAVIVQGMDADLALVPVPKLIDGHHVLPPQNIERVQPEYPEDARAQKVQGKIILEAVIDTEGNVDDVKVLRFVEGFPSLAEAAIKAVRQWRYLPAMENGRPVKSYFTVVIEFQLPPVQG
ncbi:MAG: hypothetical protein DMF49_13210 [Acidobacteria bacterium]|nr:MAG: hypothetical protein DMF49_13210 [Acidobacteriota bacterium]